MILLTKKIETTGTAENATHYQQSSKQPIEFMQEVMTPSQFEGFLIGNIIKYRMRAKYKGKYEEDIRKANQYNYWLDLFKQGVIINPTKDTLPKDYIYTGVF